MASIGFGANYDYDEFIGNSSKAPWNSTTTYRVVRRWYHQFPKTTATVASTTSKFKCAVLAHCLTTGAGKMQCIVSTNGVTGSTFTQTTTGLQLLTTPSGDSSLDFTSQTMGEVTVSLKTTVAPGSSKGRIIGVGFAFTT